MFLLVLSCRHGVLNCGSLLSCGGLGGPENGGINGCNPATLAATTFLRPEVLPGVTFPLWSVFTPGTSCIANLCRLCRKTNLQEVLQWDADLPNISRFSHHHSARLACEARSVWNYLNMRCAVHKVWWFASTSDKFDSQFVGPRCLNERMMDSSLRLHQVLHEVWSQGSACQPNTAWKWLMDLWRNTSSFISGRLQHFEATLLIHFITEICQEPAAVTLTTIHFCKAHLLIEQARNKIQSKDSEDWCDVAKIFVANNSSIPVIELLPHLADCSWVANSL